MICLLLVISVIIIIIPLALWCRRKQRENFLMNRISFSAELHIPLPLEAATRAVGKRLCEKHACELVNAAGMNQHYQRGTSDKCGSNPSDLGTWFERTTFVDVTYWEERQVTVARVVFRLPRDEVLTVRVVKQFVACAILEMCGLAIHTIGTFDDGTLHNANPTAKPVDAPDDEATEKVRLEGIANDYLVLELQPGAAWPVVQAAFRESCMKYHPDRLVGQPRHLIDLSEREFKARTEAYHRLKAAFGT